jgi:hypothetical protein
MPVAARSPALRVLARAAGIIASKLWPRDCFVNRRIANMENIEMYGNRNATLLSFVTGLGAGVALTVLFAPRSGVAMRRLIGRKVEEGQDWMTDKAAAAQDYVRDRGEELFGRVKEVAEVIGRH